MNKKIIKEDKPEANKVYKLTGGRGEKCIANGNTWAESAFDKIDHLEKQMLLEQEMNNGN